MNFSKLKTKIEQKRQYHNLPPAQIYFREQKEVREAFVLEKIAEIIEKTDNLVWGPAMLLLLLGTGIYLMLSLKFLPLLKLPAALEMAFSGEGQKKGEKGISSFSSLTTELAATIGTGNIVGVATAMVLGGPGALLWMMLSALVGMAVKLVESMLAVKYRSRNERGEYVGGPMYTMENGLKSPVLGRLLGAVFSAFAVLASFGMGNMTQANSIAAAMKITFDVPEAKTGLIVSVATILAVLGGIRTISRITQIIVPFMGILYLGGAFFVICSHLGNIPEGLMEMITAAFCPEAVSGGILGSITITLWDSLRFGVSRGVFSNEAGLGAAGISAAAADTEDYIKQAYISMTGVFLDTIVICFITGLAIAASGALGMRDEAGALLTGTELTIAAFGTVFGEAGAYFICICVTLFAFATIVGWAYQGEKAFEFLVRRADYCIFYRFFYGLVSFVGAVCALEVVWDFSDICNALMAVPNLICVLLLSKSACRELRQDAALRFAAPSKRASLKNTSLRSSSRKNSFLEKVSCKNSSGKKGS